MTPAVTALPDDTSTRPSRLAAIVLAAGEGTRMRSARAKVLHEIAGRSMIAHVCEALRPLTPMETIVVLGREMPDVARLVAPARTVVQYPPRGTGDAVRAARRVLAERIAPHGPVEDLVVVFGDTPLLRPETITLLLEERRRDPKAAVVVAAFRPADAASYGRLVLGATGALERIVEAGDATPAERAIGLCNGGIMALDAMRAFELVDALTCDNAKGEFYLTDIVALARSRGLACRIVELPEEDLIGVNTRADLAAAEAILQGRLRRRALDEGVTLVAPETVFFAADTRLGRDVVVEPNVVFGPGVTVGDGARIRAFSHLDGAVVGPGAIIGPYARLRPGAVLDENVHVGNFVEVKASRLAAGVKANHLSYIGDSDVGAGTNIGAGTITCNYDGVHKHRTVIGGHAFIGSNTALVAPVSVGDGAVVAAGSVVVHDVPADGLTIARGRQVDKAGGGAALRARLEQTKR